MTAVLSAAVDPLAGATPADHAALLSGTLGALLADCEHFGLRPTDLDIHAELGAVSCMVQFGSDPAAVDTMAAAYSLPAAADGGGLYGRSGPVTVDGHPVQLTVYSARPADPPALPVAAETPAGEGPAPALPGGLPLTVASERADQ